MAAMGNVPNNPWYAMPIRSWHYLASFLNASFSWQNRQATTKNSTIFILLYYNFKELPWAGPYPSPANLSY
jgi:hypothetical protein